MKGAFSSDNWKEWQEISDGTRSIDNHMPISSHSKFGDNEWNFNDFNNTRIITKSPHSLFVKWHKYEDTVPYNIIYSIKILGFFCVHCPAIISSSYKVSKKGLAPTYCCQLMNVALTFFSEVCRQAVVANVGTTPITSYIQTLADINTKDIEDAFLHWKTKSLVEQLCKVLRLFTSPVIQKYLPISSSNNSCVGWEYIDVKLLDIPFRKKAFSGEGSGFRDKPLPDDLFVFLVNKAAKDVLSFLISIEKVPCSYTEGIDKFDSLINHNNFKIIYEQYLRISDERYAEIKKRIPAESIKNIWNTKYSNQFYNMFNITHGAVRGIIERAQTSAKYLLLQFTGLRYSEAALLRKGCVKELSAGDYVIKGTVCKGKSVNSLTDLDYWVACPIVRDAITVLEELTNFTKCEYLFATNRRTNLDKIDKPITSYALNCMLTTYLYNIDVDRKYSSNELSDKPRHEEVYLPYRLTTHRLRHTLALHMSRAKLGIPYISMHLKHAYQAHKRFQSVQDATIRYGGIENDIFNNAVGIKQATRELIDSIYHPEAPVAGPGAEEFKQNRTFYFTGMMAADWTLEEILQSLAERGMPIADVGLGYCQGKREVEENGIKQLPPCLGQLKCNPSHCKNAIIPQSKIPMWIKMYKANRQFLSDPLMVHATPEISQIVEECQKVLLSLGVNVNEL